ncbi:MAG: DNA repair protein RecO [Deltaproteobacteria bacterium]|nr:DNA repair protein RecO [Deltaproteobacteria bacterium]
MLETVHDEIIITSLVKYGDNDAIARVFTQEHGRLSLFCRSAFKPSKRRGSTVQTMARGRAGFKLKEHKLSTLTELDIGAYTHALASSLRGFSLAAYACEIVEVFVAEHDPAPKVFDLLDNFLRLASSKPISTLAIRTFESKLLQACGLLSIEESKEQDLKKMADLFTWHLRQHKQTPLKSLAFFKQVMPS